MIELILAGIGVVGVGYALYKISEIEGTTKKISAPINEMEQLEKRLIKLREDFNNLLAEYGDVGQVSVRLRRLEDKQLEISAEFKEFDGKLNSFADEFSKVEKMFETSGDRQGETEGRLSELEADIAQLSQIAKRLTAFEESVMRLEAFNAQLSDEAKRLDSDMRNMKDKLEEMKFIVGSLQSFKKELSETTTGIANKTGELERRMQKIEAFFEYAKDIERSVRAMSAKFDAFDKSKSLMFDLLTKTREEVKETSEQMKAVRAPVVYKLLKNIESDVSKHERAVNDLSYEVSLMRARLHEMQAKYSELVSPDAFQLLTYEKDLQRLGARLDDIQKTLADIEEDAKEL